MGTRKNRVVEAVLTSTHNLCFEQKYEKYQNLYLNILIILVVKFSVYLNRHVSVMPSLYTNKIDLQQKNHLGIVSRNSYWQA